MHSFKKILSPILLILPLILFNGCSSTTESGAVGIERKQLLLVSSADVNQMALKAYTQLQSEAASKKTLNQDPAQLQRVRAIAKRITPQTGVFRSDAPGWNWEVNVISSKELNAFCMPGGKIMFYSGLIDQLHLSDAEIAVVMGHEIAHALREHSREQVSQALLTEAFIGLATSSEGASNLAGGVYKVLVAPNFSRTDETEADRIGLELAARAGYDPHAGVTLWQKMIATNQGAHPPEFLSSHPADASRVQEIESLLPTVEPLYEKARR
ncbi:MAG: M48 family peptidase [Burkholderiaceae bacterium]|nr:MAG: M48 family peptidase [Burkholderiaceae bacterium]